MAASNKFELLAGSPDGPLYANGPRRSYTISSLDRPGSSRETADSRSSSSLASMSKGGTASSHGDVVNMVRSFPLDIRKIAADQKFPRQGEIKRMITSALGIAQDNTTVNTVNMKSLPSSSQGEIRRVKAILSDGSNKASSRSKMFGEAALIVDKACQGSVTKKRFRADISLNERLNAVASGERPASGGSTSRISSQNHLTSGGFGGMPCKSEEKAKNAISNRRARTSIVDVEMDIRINSPARPTAYMDKERDMFKLGTGSGTTQFEEKDRPLATGSIEMWEKSKMRKKRSGIKSDVSNSSKISSRPPVDGERDIRSGIQQKSDNDLRGRLSMGQGFRSAAVNGLAGVGKLDVTAQQSGLTVHSTTRNDQDTAALTDDRRDRLAVLEKEKMSLKAAHKTTPREESNPGSPSLVKKVNASARGPRSSSGSSSKLSPKIPRQVGTPEELESSQSANGLHSISGPTNRKRIASVRSPSPPITQWIGQRPQKITRVARRTHFVPLVSSHDEPSSSETAAAGLDIPKRVATHSTQQAKLKIDHTSATGLASDDSGAAETKTKYKGGRSGEVVDKAEASIMKVTSLTLPSRKNKVGSDEDLSDGRRRQGRAGQGFTSLRSGLPSAIEKLDNGTKQTRSARLGSYRIECKAGRPPNKKSSERKTSMHPKFGMDIGSSGFAGDSDDDYDELLAAANAALNSGNACPPFWEQVEPVFRFAAAGDINFLKEQVVLSEQTLANIGDLSEGDAKAKGDIGSNLDPAADGWLLKEHGNAVSNGSDEENFEKDAGTKSVIPLSVRVLAAVIDVDELDKLYCNTRQRETEFLLDTEMDSPRVHHPTLDNCQTVGWAACNGHGLVAPGLSKTLDSDKLSCMTPVPDASLRMGLKHALTDNGSRSHSSDKTGNHYTELCLDDKILLELQSVGLFPESLPDLTLREEDEISEAIMRLEEKLYRQAVKNKSTLQKLEKAVSESKGHEERKLECLAMGHLLRMAYVKYMACWGPSTSGGKNSSSKAAKRAALSFVERVLMRCHKYEETGRSCFSEPPFRDLLAFAHSKAELVDIGEVGPANAFIEHSPCPSEMKVSSDPFGADQAQKSNLQSLQNIDGQENYNSDVGQSGSRQNHDKEDNPVNRAKRRELLLDDVVGGPLSSSAKGKRSERDRDGKGHMRDMLTRNVSAPKVGRPALGSTKGERKTKTKPKKVTQLSASVNGLLGKVSGPPRVTSSEVPKLPEIADGNPKERDQSRLSSSKDTEEPIDLSHLQLPGMDVLGAADGLDDQAQDLGSWLNIGDEGLLDNDFMGLGIPMDDLSDLNMMV